MKRENLIKHLVLSAIISGAKDEDTPQGLENLAEEFIGDREEITDPEDLIVVTSDFLEFVFE